MKTLFRIEKKIGKDWVMIEEGLNCYYDSLEEAQDALYEFEKTLNWDLSSNSVQIIEADILENGEEGANDIHYMPDDTPIYPEPCQRCGNCMYCLGFTKYDFM